MTNKILIVYGDRATFDVGDVHVPVDEVLKRSTKDWFKRNLRLVDPEEHLKYQVEVQPGATSLQDIFARKGRYLGANDTSAAVGYAPYSRLERLILNVEDHMNSQEFKRRFPESGEDVKIMGSRNGNGVTLTVAQAFVDRYIESEADYFRKKGEIYDAVNAFIAEKSDFDNVRVGLNVLDAKGRGIGGLYLTVLGSSIDTGDSGQVGRGNNVIGVIPLNRPMSSEAAAGKNPVSHVGKIYNLLSYRIAGEICQNVNGVKETYVWLVSAIGQPIDKPAVCSAQVIPADGVSLEEITPQIQEVIASEFDRLDEFCMDLAQGKVNIK